jgi:hypothetical protein
MRESTAHIDRAAHVLEVDVHAVRSGGFELPLELKPMPATGRPAISKFSRPRVLQVNSA